MRRAGDGCGRAARPIGARRGERSGRDGLAGRTAALPLGNPKNERYVRYHDGEWGVPLHDEKRLFELLTLECFQAGLSWECVLNKREAFRRAFGGFDPGAVAAYGEEKLRALQNDPGIIRNERKIRAAVGNARVFLAVERGVWQLRRLSVGLEPAAACCTSEGFRARRCRRRSRATSGGAACAFFGPTVAYAFLQAAGVINGHEPGCFLAPPGGAAGPK